MHTPEVLKCLLLDDVHLPPYSQNGSIARERATGNLFSSFHERSLRTYPRPSPPLLFSLTAAHERPGARPEHFGSGGRSVAAFPEGGRPAVPEGSTRAAQSAAAGCRRLRTSRLKRGRAEAAEEKSGRVGSRVKPHGALQERQRSPISRVVLERPVLLSRSDPRRQAAGAFTHAPPRTSTFSPPPPAPAPSP